MCANSFDFHSNSASKCSHSEFIVGDTGAQSGWVTCPRSHS